MIHVPLLLDIVCYGVLVAMSSYGTCKIPVRPELSAPQLFLYLGTPFEYLPGCNAFDDRYYPAGAVCWDGLHEEMHMILVRTNLKKFHLVTFLDLNTYLFHYFINVFVKYRTSVFCRKHQMVDEHRNIMAFMYIFAHLHILRRKRRGIQPEVIQT